MFFEWVNLIVDLCIFRILFVDCFKYDISVCFCRCFFKIFEWFVYFVGRIFMFFFIFFMVGVIVFLNEVFVFFFFIFVCFVLLILLFLVMLVFVFFLIEWEIEMWEVLCFFMIRDKFLYVLFFVVMELDCLKLYL